MTNETKRVRCTILVVGLLSAALNTSSTSEVEAASVYANAVLANNPIAYWRLGETTGSVATDLSPNGLNGTYTGGVLLNQPGAISSDTDRSVSLDGTTGFVSVASDPRLNQLTNNFTIEAWIHPGDPLPGNLDPLPAFRIVSTRSFEPPSQRGFAFSVESDNTLWFMAFAVKDYHSGVVVPRDAWSNVAVTFDAANTARFYVNGVLRSTITGSAPAFQNSSSLDIGREPILSALGIQSYFNGGIDDVAIYNQALSAADINQHYLASTPEPSSVMLAAFGFIGLAAWGFRSQRTKSLSEYCRCHKS